jgi:hypothetical protein
VRGGELKHVAIAARNQYLAAALFLHSDRGREKIIGLEPRAPGVGEAARRNDFRQQCQLFKQRVVEFAPALIGRIGVVAIRGRIQRIPTDQHCTRLLCRVDAQQEVGKAHDRAAGLLARAHD